MNERSSGRNNPNYSVNELMGRPISRRDLFTVATGFALTGLGTGQFLASIGVGNQEASTTGLPSDLDSSARRIVLDENPEHIETGGTKLEVFIEKYESLAKQVESQYNVPYQVTLAMGMLESGYGESELATAANNYHGMKDNEEWSGNHYSILTKENVPGADLAKYEVIGEPVDLGDGMFEITIDAKFKQFGSVEDGFMGFGDHLRNRFKGEAYADAFEVYERTNNPYDFLYALFDTQGARYGTDIEYLEKVIGILDQVTAEKGKDLSGSVELTAWNDLGDWQQRQFGDMAEYNKIADQLKLVVISADKYKQFTEKIEDVSSEISATEGFHDIYPGKDKSMLPANPRLVLHHTGWVQKSAWGYDAKTFVGSLINTYNSTGRKVSANYYLDRQGKLAVLTDSKQAAYHAGGKKVGYPHYNAEATGVEMPAGRQSDITPEMYEGAVYLAAWQYRVNNPRKKPSQKEMRKYVIGHGEIAEFTKGEVTDHNDFPRAVADAVADLAYQLLQEVK